MAEALDALSSASVEFIHHVSVTNKDSLWKKILSSDSSGHAMTTAASS
jgi:hypothetical protein